MTTAEKDDPQARLAAIGEIAAEVAHELRNVLQVISASAFLARQAPEASAPHIAKIERNARLAHAIVDDLMALARGEAAYAESTLLIEVCAAARTDLDPDAVRFVDAFDTSSFRLRIHPGLATRLLHVLYENAIAVSQPNVATIETRAYRDGARGLAVIEVADDGPGVPEGLASRIFQPLVSGRSGGTGLGLALAKRIALAHGGSIALVPSDRGATFRIEIPDPR